MSYLRFFGLSSEPFSNVAVGKFYYNSPRHLKALAKLTYAVETKKGLALLVGDIGAGKTTLARRFLDTLPEEKYEAALIVMVHSAVTPDWMLKKIAQQIGVADPSHDKLKLLGQLYERLVEIHETGKKTVVLVDEAQMLQTREIMEEFRGLLNLETPDGKLINFIFFGLADLDKNLRLDEPLSNRVAMRIKLEALNLAETDGYIKHRMGVAGGASAPFTKDAISIIFEYSKGIPRRINAICDNALLEAFLIKKNVIDGELMMEVVHDLGIDKRQAPLIPPLDQEDSSLLAEEIQVEDTSSSDLPSSEPPEDEIDLILKGLEKK